MKTELPKSAHWFANITDGLVPTGIALFKRDEVRALTVGEQKASQPLLNRAIARQKISGPHDSEAEARTAQVKHRSQVQENNENLDNLDLDVVANGDGTSTSVQDHVEDVGTRRSQASVTASVPVSMKAAPGETLPHQEPSASGVLGVPPAPTTSSNVDGELDARRKNKTSNEPEVPAAPSNTAPQAEVKPDPELAPKAGEESDVPGTKAVPPNTEATIDPKTNEVKIEDKSADAEKARVEAEKKPDDVKSEPEVPAAPAAKPEIKDEPKVEPKKDPVLDEDDGDIADAKTTSASHKGKNKNQGK